MVKEYEELLKTAVEKGRVKSAGDIDLVVSSVILHLSMKYMAKGIEAIKDATDENKKVSTAAQGENT